MNKLSVRREPTALQRFDSDTVVDKKGNPKHWVSIKRNTRAAAQELGAFLVSPLAIVGSTFMHFLNPERPKGGMLRFFGAMVGGAFYSLGAALKDFFVDNAVQASMLSAKALLGDPWKKK